MSLPVWLGWNAWPTLHHKKYFFEGDAHQVYVVMEPMQWANSNSRYSNTDAHKSNKSDSLTHKHSIMCILINCRAVTVASRIMSVFFFLEFLDLFNITKKLNNLKLYGPSEAKANKRGPSSLVKKIYLCASSTLHNHISSHKCWIVPKL